VGVCGANHHRAQSPQFLLKQACRAVAAQGAETVAANKLSKFCTVVGWTAAHRPHFHQPHRQTSLGYLPGGFSACEASADYQ
jgi:hypothetical protein